MEQFKILFQLYYRPASAMSELLDTGSWIFAAAAVLIVSAAFFFTVNAKLETAYHVPTFSEYYQPNFDAEDEDSPAAEAEYEKADAAYRHALAARPQIPLVGDYFFKFFSFAPGNFYQPLLLLSIFYVPCVILLMSIFGAAGSFGTVLQRSYGELATCALTAWAAAHLPFAVLGAALSQTEIAPAIWFLMWTASGVLFGVLMIFALRVVFGANYATAITVVCFAWLPMSAGMYVFRVVSPWLFSPFLLFYAYIYFGGTLSGEARGIGNAFRQKQNFKRFLHNATVNPKDADAHIQLGLIYLQRKQKAKAVEHFKRAYEIDPQEIDANYELGKTARADGNFQRAIDHFSVVLEQNDKHALSEIWREVGVTYFDAKMLPEARSALETFTERRAADVEGSYYLGKVYQAQNEPEKAREMFRQTLESAKTAPDFRRRDARLWSKLAQKEINNL